MLASFFKWTFQGFSSPLYIYYFDTALPRSTQPRSRLVSGNQPYNPVVIVLLAKLRSAGNFIWLDWPIDQDYPEIIVQMAYIRLKSFWLHLHSRFITFAVDIKIDIWLLALSTKTEVIFSNFASKGRRQRPRSIQWQNAFSNDRQPRNHVPILLVIQCISF